MNDVKLTAIYINQSTRYMLLLLVPVAFIVSATSYGFVSLVYGSDYIEAASMLEVLVFGLTFLAIFYVLAHVIIGSGKPSVAFGIALCLVAIDIGLNIFLVKRHGLMGAAWATSITSSIGMLAAAAYIYGRFKTLVSIKSLIRICLASLAVYAIAREVSLSPYFLPLFYVGLSAVYFVLLAVAREFTKQDVDACKRIIPLIRLKAAKQ